MIGIFFELGLDELRRSISVACVALAMAYLPSVVVVLRFSLSLSAGCARQCTSSATFSNAAANLRSCNWLAQSHAARFDTVEDGIVPVSVEPCDFGVRVETQNVAVRDVYVLALFCNPLHFGRHRPPHVHL